jgi:hypothetical protein
MKKVALLACGVLTVVGSFTAADAQPRFRYGHPGGWAYPVNSSRGYYGYGGGAVAAGLVGGLALGGLAAAAAAPAYYPSYPYGYAYGPYYPRAIYAAPVYGPAPYCGPGPVCAADPYALPHEIRGGYRTVYVPGRGRIIPGGPLW